MSNSWRPLTVFFGVIVLVMVVVGGFLLILPLRQVNIEARVVRFEWRETVTWDYYQTVTREGWHLPPGAREISQERRIKTTTFMKVGKTMIPLTIWGTWYRYDIDEWVPTSQEIFEGDSRENAPFSGMATQCPEQPTIGCQRERHEVQYAVVFRDNQGTEYTYPEDHQDWLAYELESRIYHLMVNSRGIQNDPLRAE